MAQAKAGVGATIENDYVKYVVSADGKNLGFIDKATSADYCTKDSPVALLRKGGKHHPAASVSYADGQLTVQFGPINVTAVIKVTAEKHYLVFEVVSVSDKDAEALTFVHLPLTLKGQADEPFAACAVALNLQTNVPGIPGRNRFLQAACYPRFGFAGAKVALVGCPQAELRKVLQEVVSAAPDLPHSSIGGPWAVDGPINYGSYLFNFGNLTEETVDDWIELCTRLGITQIDFHGGGSFRFGDFVPDPKMYPRGKASLKAVIDKLHAAGIAAGLHTYAEFMSKQCPWVTPVPDPRLGKDATFTLADAMTAEATTVPVAESTKDMSTIAGGPVRNSITLHIDNELITYAGISKQPPFAFTECKRGAWGTKAAPHAKGAKAYHLRECFGLFVPDGDSTLYAEVAAKTADIYNECGFDMMYLDALDGSDAVAGAEWSWYYGSKFTFEIWKRLKKPALSEMSTFHHHLWFVRSRMGAWDHPNRSHKKFIDIHCQANEGCRNMFLPAHLGWWAFKQWSGPQGERTFSDDIEYLCGKCIGNGNGLSIMGIDPGTINRVPALPRLAAIMRRHENLRTANYFAEPVKEKLRVPGDEYALVQSPEGEWQFRAVQYEKHKVLGLDGWSNTWKAKNKFGRQPLQLRIEALMSAGPYDAPGNITVADFTDAKGFPDVGAAKGITAKLEPSTAQVKIGPVSGCYSASSTMASPQGAWSKLGKKFDPPANLGAHQALGVWVYGDGKGEVLNLQLTDPYSISWGAISDHYILVDFTGWRYFELIEPEGERHAQYTWPYGGIYSIYRCVVHYPKIETLSLFYNNIPPKSTVTCYLSPVRALPTVKATLRNPAVTVGGKTIVFPVELESGSYLEFHSPTDCKVYGPNGELIAIVKPQGDAPILESGDNEIKFACAAAAGVNPRACVSVISEGETLRGRNPDDKIKWACLRCEQDDPKTVTTLDGVQNEWDVTCRADAGLEIEITVEKIETGGEAYNAPTAVSLEAFDDLNAFADTPENQYAKYVVSGERKGLPTAVGVTHKLELCGDVVKVGKSSARYTAASEKAGGWSARGKRFSPALNLSSCTDVGFWLHGDGKGEVLYLQLRDVAGKWHDMKTTIDFTGWKYVEFPLAGAALDLSKIEYLIIYYNGIPAGATVSCCIDDVRGLRQSASLAGAAITVGGQKLVFPVSLSIGDRLVYRADGGCKVLAANTSVPKDVKPEGAPPKLRPGRNHIQLGLTGSPPKAFRISAQVTKVYP